MARLISLSGLPGVGKTTLARELARRTGAVHLRVDSVEAAMKNSILKIHPAEDAGYLVVASLAKDNLLLGMDVIADTVNPLGVTRKLWSDVSIQAKAVLINIEVTCDDKRVHRARVESRESDLEGLVVPSWDKVMAREYEAWVEDRLTVDTSKCTAAACAGLILRELDKLA
ncbi:AAA family ATPase [Tepidicaulis sp. LMO-SS28]|uniref:AAA family ATPase n=1 Tax=Tepidicaulis sp. LMO-SS28 TaxID=3447455 RepID=UPI003EE3ED48